MMDIERQLSEANRDNPDATSDDVVLVADALKIYAEGAANVRSHGAIVQHPRTGAPIENPYLRVMHGQVSVLAKMRHVRLGRILEQLREVES